MRKIGKKGRPESGDLLNLMAFSVVYRAYKAIRETTPDDKALVRGHVVARQYADQLQVALDLYVKPLLGREGTGVLISAWNRARRLVTPAEVVENVGEFVPVMLAWMQAHNAFDEVFGSAAGLARGLGRASQATDPATAVASVARLPKAPTLVRVPYQWIQGVANDLGVGPERSTRAALAIRGIAPLVEAAQTAAAQRDVAEHGSAEQATHAADATRLQANIEEEIAASANPAVVEAAVSAMQAQDKLADIQERYRLDPEQAAIALATGKMVAPAGAGSGKTHTGVAKIEYLVKECRVPPQRILMASFTRKAVAEIRERLNQRGVRGVLVATTHSVARRMAMFIDPALGKQFDRGAEFGDKIFKIAVRQVALRDPNAPPGYYAELDAEQTFVDDEPQWGSRSAAAGSRRETPAGESRYWDRPIGAYFNLGRQPRDAKNRIITVKQLQTAAGLWSTNFTSPEVAWRVSKDLREEKPIQYYAAAAYGAYRWLCANDPIYKVAIPLDEWIPTAFRVLQANPKKAGQLQSKFDFVAADEAQDFNDAQYRLFKLLGAKAKTQMFIGDDFQAIYEFRGADPDQFIQLPEEGYKVFPITTNYRSGKAIVEAANRLIAHNTKQIPKVCQARKDRESAGLIEAIRPATHEEGALDVASRIYEGVHEGERPDAYGILVRTNAESDAYCIALLARGIPFRCERDFFSGRAVKTLLAWITLAVGAAEEAVNDAVMTAHQIPGFFLGKAFGAALRRVCPHGASYRDYVLANRPVYEESKRDARVFEYADAIRRVRESRGHTETLLKDILTIEGSKKNGAVPTFLDVLREEVDPEDLNGDDDEALDEAAKAPIRPLLKMGAKFQDPRKLLEMVDKLRSSRLRNQKGDDDVAPAVLVGTVHSWKGLECDHAFVCMAGGVFPNFVAEMRETEGDSVELSNERRLGYVALTRGRESVTVVAPERNYFGIPLPPSRFLEEACIPWENANASQGSPETRAASIRTGRDFENEIFALLDDSLDDDE